MKETIFPTGDLTMISVDLFDKSAELMNLIEGIKKLDFPAKGETIANITLAIRHMEDAEYRVVKAREYIIASSNVEVD